MRAFSAAAVRQFFSPEADDPLLLLVTITSGQTTLRFANGYTGRLEDLETDEFTTIYGVVSRGQNFIFLPMEITLPTEDDAAPRARIALHDVTREAMPLIRAATAPPSVTLELVLASAPNIVEMACTGLIMTAISYTRDAIVAELSADDLALEPFPAHTFVPASFPGMF